MSSEGNGPVAEGSPPAEVDRIRDIIFGPQMRLYEQQFKRLAGQVDALQRDLEQLRASLGERLVEAMAASQQAGVEIREESRQSLAQLRSELSSRGDQQGEELRDQIARVGADLRTQGQDLRNEFIQALDALDQDKASRDNVGDLLIEMGTRLKQQLGIADLLGQIQIPPDEEPAE